MKKKRYSVLINIATICLCVCAIAVGVYAAKSATLNVTGSVGFTAHDLDVSVSAVIRNAIRKNNAEVNNQTYNADTSGLDNDVVWNDSYPETSITGTGTTWTFGEIYFNDLGSNEIPAIEIEFTIKNNTVEYGAGASIEGLPEDTSDVKFEVKECPYIAKKGTGTAKTGKVTISLVDPNRQTSLTNAINLSTIKLVASKSSYQVEEIFDLKYTGGTGTLAECVSEESRNKTLVMNMGTEKGVPIRWFAYAIKGVNTGKGYIYENKYYATDTANTGTVAERWYSLRGIDIETLDLTDKELWFIQEYVTDGGYEYGNCDWEPGVVYNYYTSDTYYNNNYNNIYANGNTKSNIYNYLTGTSVHRNGEETATTNYLDKMSIRATKEYKQISNREVAETYEGLTTTGSYAYPSSTQNNNFTSKLWLLSQAELMLLYNTTWNYDEQKYVTGINETKSLSYCDNCGDFYGASWWLRSPYPSHSYLASSVTSPGSLYFGSVSGYRGVRSAFQIQM